MHSTRKKLSVGESCPYYNLKAAEILKLLGFHAVLSANAAMDVTFV